MSAGIWSMTRDELVEHRRDLNRQTLDLRVELATLLHGNDEALRLLEQLHAVHGQRVNAEAAWALDVAARART